MNDIVRRKFLVGMEVEVGWPKIRGYVFREADTSIDNYVAVLLPRGIDHFHFSRLTVVAAPTIKSEALVYSERRKFNNQLVRFYESEINRDENTFMEKYKITINEALDD